VTRPLLDTHVWVWWVTGDARLDVATRSTLDTLVPDQAPFLSVISLWEVAMLVERKRVAFSTPLDEWLRAAVAPGVVETLSITPEIAAATAGFHSRLHGDPADRLIVATSRRLDLPLATDDKKILRSGLVERWIPDT
jgi:PIN domain nuclease of toxin-antitoxin system